MDHPARPSESMHSRVVRTSYAIVYIGVAAAFGACALALLVFALVKLASGIVPSEPISLHSRFAAVLEAIGILTIAVAALELSETVVEEEVRRHAYMSAPTRVRRFLSR